MIILLKAILIMNSMENNKIEKSMESDYHVTEIQCRKLQRI